MPAHTTTLSYEREKRNRGIADALARLFASISTHNTYALLVATYSAILGIFIPSGGSRWVIEAPYVLQAVNLNQVHLGWVVRIYNASEALPDLVIRFGCSHFSAS